MDGRHSRAAFVGLPHAVVFDVDVTIARPGPDLGPEGYRELGLRYGLASTLPATTRLGPLRSRR